VICRAAVAETVTHSAGGRAATADRALAPTAVAAHPAWDLEVAGVGVEGVEVEVVAAEGRRHGCGMLITGARNEINMCE
jgi:hypothetical protein